MVPGCPICNEWECILLSFLKTNANGMSDGTWKCQENKIKTKIGTRHQTVVASALYGEPFNPITVTKQNNYERKIWKICYVCRCWKWRFLCYGWTGQWRGATQLRHHGKHCPGGQGGQVEKQKRCKLPGCSLLIPNELARKELKGWWVKSCRKYYTPLICSGLSQVYSPDPFYSRLMVRKAQKKL